MNIVAIDGPMGAQVEDLDLSTSMSAATVDAIIAALGRFGVLCFPKQSLDAHSLAAFSANFGKLEINVANSFQEPGVPEVMILSNIVRDGKAIGLLDAGQDWHTDMSYSRTIAFANVLYAIEVPQRNGQPLGATQFRNMHAAWEALPTELQARLETMTATHDFNKFWDMMRRERGSTRPPLTEAQRQAKPPVSQPLCLIHPITGRKVLYANPGYATRINELPQTESDELLAFLFEHQLQERFAFEFRWQVGDVLMWDNFGTIHKAIADYGADEHRLIKRCQVMATRFFETA